MNRHRIRRSVQAGVAIVALVAAAACGPERFSGEAPASPAEPADQQVTPPSAGEATTTVQADPAESTTTTGAGTTDTTDVLDEAPITDTSVPGRDGYRDAIGALAGCMREAGVLVKLKTADASQVTLAVNDAQVENAARATGCIEAHIGPFEGVAVNFLHTDTQPEPGQAPSP